MGKEYLNGDKKNNKAKSPKDNKKIILIAVAAVLVVAAIVAAIVIPKIKGDAGTDAESLPNAQGQEEITTSTTGNLKQPVIEEGTVVIEYPSKDANGKEVTVTRVSEVNDFANQLRAGDTLDTLSQDKKDRFVARYADFGISEATAKEMVKDGTTWISFYMDIYVANSEGESAAMSMLSSKAGDGIYMDKQLGSEYGIPSGRGTYVTIEGVLDSSKYETEEEILATLRSMDIKIIYTLMENSADSVDDWSQVTTAYMPVTF